MSETLDYKLLNFLRNKVSHLNKQDRELLHGLITCQTKTAPSATMPSGVFLLNNKANPKQSVLYGVNTCKNTWICPVCSARKMATYKRKIASAISAMKERNQHAAMLTFTTIHNRWFTCEESLLILKNSMKKLNKRVYANMKKSKKFESNAWSRCFVDLELKQYVQVAEITYGKNSWHPHYHVLYWTKDVQKFAEHEAAIGELWTKIVKEETIKLFEQTKNVSNVRARVEEMFERARKSPCFYISKTKEGKISAFEASDYICGWGGDNELAGHKKQAHEGHYTQWQILDIAAEQVHDDKLSSDKAWELYLDFMKAVRKHRFKRVKFSQPKGETLNSIITKWEQVNTTREFLKKKPPTEWVVVCWFSNQQWQEICYLEEFSPIISNILYLAYDTRLLLEYLRNYNIIPLVNLKNPAVENIEYKMNLQAA